MPPGAGSCARRARPGSSSGTSWKIPTRASCATFTCSQRSRTSPAVSASASPNTCGWRWISLRVTPSATSAQSPWPTSEQSSARNVVWNRRSPSSSISFGRRARLARRLGDLVGLLEGVRHDRLDRLRPVPRALEAQGRGQLQQLGRGLRRHPQLEPRAAAAATPQSCVADQLERAAIERGDRVRLRNELDPVASQPRGQCGRCPRRARPARPGAALRAQRRGSDRGHRGRARRRARPAARASRWRSSSPWWWCSSRRARSPPRR